MGTRKYEDLDKSEILKEMKRRDYFNLKWYKKFTARKLRVMLENEDTHKAMDRMAQRVGRR